MLRALQIDPADPLPVSLPLQEARHHFLQRRAGALRAGMYPLRWIQVKARMRELLPRLRRTPKSW